MQCVFICSPFSSAPTAIPAAGVLNAQRWTPFVSLLGLCHVIVAQGMDYAAQSETMHAKVKLPSRLDCEAPVDE